MTNLHYKRRAILSAGILLMFSLMLVSCHKELERWPNYLRTHYLVFFDWTDAPKANPSVMNFITFQKGMELATEFGFTKKTGGEIDLAAGEYQSLAFNSDTEVLYYRGTMWETFEIYTRRTSLTNYSDIFSTSKSFPRGEGSEDEPIIEEPDMLWTGSAAEMPPAGDKQIESVTLHMQPAVFTYRFVITNVANLEHVINITATLSGMSESMFPSTGKVSDTHCIIPVSVKIDDRQTLICTVHSFGHCPDDNVANHHLMVYARLSDGSKWYYDFDVTAELHKSAQTVTDEDGNVIVEIKLDRLPFPMPISSDDGLHPDVEEWNDVNVDIKM